MIVPVKKSYLTHFDRELFLKLSLKGRDLVLPFFDLTPRELPFERECAIAAPLANKQCAIATDETGNYLDHLFPCGLHEIFGSGQEQYRKRETTFGSSRGVSTS